MLINFSNNPSNQWSEEQKQAAENQYGEIIDMKFPLIDSEANEFQIDKLAESYFNKIRKQISKSGVMSQAHVVVLIMGEMTFCYKLIGLFENKGYQCVAATTERIVKRDNVGNKTTEYRFVQFRNYF